MTGHTYMRAEPLRPGLDDPEGMRDERGRPMVNVTSPITDALALTADHAKFPCVYLDVIPKHNRCSDGPNCDPCKARDILRRLR